MNLILGFVGKTHAPKMCRAFDLSKNGADPSYEVPSEKVLDTNALESEL